MRVCGNKKMFSMKKKNLMDILNHFPTKREALHRVSNDEVGFTSLLKYTKLSRLCNSKIMKKSLSIQTYQGFTT